jgi:hypothetical protein
MKSVPESVSSTETGVYTGGAARYDPRIETYATA